MEMEDLLKFIKEEHERLMKFYGFKENHELKYTITLKIMEELGELCQEVLHSDSMQRKEKLARKSRIEQELPDVIFTTLLLAENLGIDVKSAIKKKLEKIRKRDY